MNPAHRLSILISTAQLVLLACISDLERPEHRKRHS